MWQSTSVILATQEAEGKRSWSEAGKTVRASLKNKKAKMSGRVAQVVENLPRKHKAQSLNPSTTRKKINNLRTQENSIKLKNQVQGETGCSVPALEQVPCIATRQSWVPPISPFYRTFSFSKFSRIITTLSCRLPPKTTENQGECVKVKVNQFHCSKSVSS
jgi:hypothetical protein